MGNFKGIHNYVRIYIQTHHFLKIFSRIHIMSSKPIASAGCDNILFLCKKVTFQIQIYTLTRVSVTKETYAPSPPP